MMINTGVWRETGHCYYPNGWLHGQHRSSDWQAIEMESCYVSTNSRYIINHFMGGDQWYVGDWLYNWYICI